VPWACPSCRGWCGASLKGLSKGTPRGTPPGYTPRGTPTGLRLLTVLGQHIEFQAAQGGVVVQRARGLRRGAGRGEEGERRKGRGGRGRGGMGEEGRGTSGMCNKVLKRRASVGDSSPWLPLHCTFTVRTSKSPRTALHCTAPRGTPQVASLQHTTARTSHAMLNSSRTGSPDCDPYIVSHRLPIVTLTSYPTLKVSERLPRLTPRKRTVEPTPRPGSGGCW